MVKADRRAVVMDNVKGDLLWLINRKLFGEDFPVKQYSEIYKRMIGKVKEDTRTGDDILNDILNKYGGAADG